MTAGSFDGLLEVLFSQPECISVTLLERYFFVARSRLPLFGEQGLVAVVPDGFGREADLRTDVHI